MQLTWESDLKELVDTHYQMMYHVKEGIALRRKGLYAGAAVVGIPTFAILVLLLPRTAPLVPFWVNLAVAVTCGLGAAILSALTQPSTMKKRLRRLLRGRFRPGEPRIVTMVLSPEGVTTKTPEHQLAFEWSQIDEVDDTGDSVYFYARSGIAGVPNKAFESESMRTQFVDEAKGYLAKAQQSKDRCRF
jgi:hypothetical protein